MKDDLLERISALAGQGVAKAIQKEFGGTTRYISSGAYAKGCRCGQSATQLIKDALDRLADLYPNNARLKGRIERLVEEVEQLERLTPAGGKEPATTQKIIDVVIRDIESDGPSIKSLRAALRNPNEIRVNRGRCQHLRWLLLRCLYQALPEDQPELTLLAYAQRVGYPDVSLTEARSALKYLAGHDLVTYIGETSKQPWALTAHGIDVVEYTTPCPPGVARPSGKWAC